MRLVSFWLFWVLALLALVGLSSISVVTSDTGDPMLYIYSLIALAGISLATLLDYHWTTVVIYHAKSHSKRMEKEAKEKEKRTRAEARYKEHSRIALGGVEGDEESAGNPVVVPSNLASPRSPKPKDDFSKI